MADVATDESCPDCGGGATSEPCLTCEPPAPAAVCRHGEREPHHYSADDYPRRALWFCSGPDE